MYLEPSPRQRRRQRRRLILYALLGIGLGVVIGMLSAKVGAAPWPDTTAPAWHLQADVQAQSSAAGLTTFTAAVPARLCQSWRWYCSAYRRVFGIPICQVWQFRCVKYVHDSDSTGRVAGVASHLEGNRGGCGRRGENMRYGVACNITDAGVGFVSGACEDGLWFSRVATRRTFRLDQAVRVDGCEGLGSELYAPIRISR